MDAQLTRIRRSIAAALRFIGFYLFLAALAVAVDPAARWRAGEAAGTVAQVLGLGVVALVANVCVHEAGHALAARLVGFSLAGLVLGPLQIGLGGRRPRLELRRGLVLGGVAVTVPGDGRDLRRRVGLTVAGGPLAGAALAVLAGALAGLSRAGRLGLLGGGWIGLLLAETSIVSALLTVRNAIPGRSRRLVLNDGARLRLLLRGGSAAARWCALLLLNAAGARGERPRTWDPAAIAQATALPDGSLDDIGGCLVAYYWALDRGDAAQARAFLDRAMAAPHALPEAMRQGILQEGAYLAARHDHDPQAARALLAQADHIAGLPDRAARLRVEAAVLLAEGACAQAREKAQAALAALEGGVQAEEDWLREVVEGG